MTKAGGAPPGSPRTLPRQWGLIGRRWWLLGIAGVIVGVAVPEGAGAQVTDTTQVPVDSVVVTPEADPVITATADTAGQPVSPRGAFIRSLAIPGWGQAEFGSYTRGGIYFAGWVGNWFMIFRNQVRLDEARNRYDRRVGQIEAGLITASENPDSMRMALARDPSILEAAVRADQGPGNTGNNLRLLVNAREQQREDWIAWSIFWLLASGIDAYVTAHLYDMPTDIELRTNPDRSMTVRVDVPLPWSRP